MEELNKAYGNLAKELKEMEIRRDVMGCVVADMRRQYDDIVENVIRLRGEMEHIEKQRLRIRQSTTEKERSDRIAEAALKRQRENLGGYRLGNR